MREWITLIEHASFDLPSVWYHSTEGDPVEVAADFKNNNFDPTGAAPSNQYWFSDSWEASRYYGENTVVAKLDIHNPLIVTPELRKQNFGGPVKWAAFAKSMGHDACIILDIMDGDLISNVCCVFSADQIDAKPYSRWNEERGDFDFIQS